MISLCVLSYNRGDFLKHTIRCAVAMADKPLEIIVHDDGSTDMAARDMLQRTLDAGGISHLMMNPMGHNEGQGVAVNRMFNAASGDILVKCDQDLMFARGWDTEVERAFHLNAGIRIAAEKEGYLHPPPRIGALGLFKYHQEPVRFEDTIIKNRGSYYEVTDFVGSFIAVPRLAWETLGPWEERSPAFAEDAEYKRWVSEASGWCCALTAEDHVRNIGFGPERSTVIDRIGEDGQPVVHEIKAGPRLVERVEA